MASRFSRIGLIGSSGIIGASFLNALNGKDVITFGRQKQHTHFLDLDRPFKADVFEGIDLLVFAAGIRDEDLEDNPAAQWRLNEGQKALVSAIEFSKISAVINISSAHVYGNLSEKITEETPAMPCSAYAKAHFSFEQALQELSKRTGVSVLNVRPNAVYGLDMGFENLQRPHLIPYLFPRLAVLQGELTVKAPAVHRNFVSANHIATWSLKEIEIIQHGAAKILNPIGSFSLTIGAFAALVATRAKETLGLDVTINQHHTSDHSTFQYASTVVQDDTDLTLDTFLENYLHYLGPCGTLKTEIYRER